MHTQMSDLKAQYQSIKGEIYEAIYCVLDSQNFINGEQVKSLEDEIANYCGCRYAIGVSSGTDALLACLMAINLKPGDEVITTDYSFIATASCISRLGAIPVFVDIDPRTYNIDTDQIENKITPNTRAIIPVQLCGQMADMGRIKEIADKYGLFIIEDACQAIGSDYKSKKAGTIGDMGCFSFYPSKNLGGYGDSGMIVTNDTFFDKRLRMLRNHGQLSKYQSDTLGGNFRMDEIQAAVLRVKLKYLEEWISKRRWIAGQYKKLLNAYWSGLPHEATYGRHTYHLFLIRSEGRNTLLTRMHGVGIETSVYYPIPLHRQPCFSYLGYKMGDFPESEKASQETLALPIYPELKMDAILEISDFVGKNLGRQNAV